MVELFWLFGKLDIFIITLVRIAGYLFTSPVLGRKEVPSALKVTMSILIVYILVFTDNISFSVVPTSIGQFISLCIVESIKGMLLGLLSSFFFSAFLTAGQIIDSQIGFQMGGILDPQYGVKTSLSANLLNIVAITVFLSLDGHLQLIKLLSNTYTMSPIGSMTMFLDFQSIFVSAFSFAFLAAVKIALPITLIILLTDVILATIIKFIPQMNIFVIGIPMKIAVGLFTMFYIIGPTVAYLDGFYDKMFESLASLFM
jgi:flagellar biosynthetic protein FliR